MKKKPARAQEELWTDHTVSTGESQIVFSDDEWMQPSSDNKGHSGRLSCRVPPPVARLVEALIASKRFPYSTVDDLVRHAVIRHLYALHAYDQTIPRTLYTAAFAIIRMVQDHEAQVAMRESIVRATQVLQELADEGDWPEVARKIAFVDATLAQMPDTSPWKRRFIQQWRKKSDRYRQQAEPGKADAMCPSTLPEAVEI